MKNRAFVTILFVVTTFATMFSSCKQEPSGPILGAAGNIVTSPAHPALTYYGLVNNHGFTSPAIFVMDSDGTHQTAVQTALSGSIQPTSLSDSIRYGASPSWSPNGGSIYFTQYGPTGTLDAIKAFDVSVNSSGAAVGNNLRTIFQLSDTNSHLTNPFCSSTATVSQLAFTVQNSTSHTLCVVSQSGGIPTNVWSVPASIGLGFCTWSPDDSRLAVVRFDSASSSTIMIFNTSNWAYVDSIAVMGSAANLEWSRAGLNKLIFAMSPSNSDPSSYLYYCDPKTGAVPITNGVVGLSPTWSPNNNSIMYFIDQSSVLYAGVKISGNYKLTSFTSLTKKVSSTAGSIVKWKR